jgi:hypothetical protein
MTEEHRLRLFDKVLKRLFGPKKDKVTGQWRRLHNEGLCDLYSSLNINRVIKSNRMGWVGHVARMGRGKVHTGLFCWGYLSLGDHSSDPRVDEDNIEMDFQEVG